jgi:hypothetical protein
MILSFVKINFNKQLTKIQKNNFLTKLKSWFVYFLNFKFFGVMNFKNCVYSWKIQILTILQHKITFKIFSKKYYLLSKFPKLHNLETQFCELLRPRAHPFQKIKRNPLNLVTFMQKSCFLGPTIFEIPQPNWY